MKNKKMKRFIASLLALTLTIAVFVVPVSANSSNYSLETFLYHMGKTVGYGRAPGQSWYYYQYWSSTMKDGKLDSFEIALLREFQDRTSGLSVDGKFGPKTKAEINKYGNNKVGTTFAFRRYMPTGAIVKVYKVVGTTAYYYYFTPDKYGRPMNYKTDTCSTSKLSNVLIP